MLRQFANLAVTAAAVAPRQPQQQLLRRCALSSTATASSTDKSTATSPIEPIQFMRLNTLQDNPGAIKKKRRVGRGIGSSKGGTCGRGRKGQKSRSGGNIHPMFQGGQTKFFKLFPKRGFNNARHETVMNPVNLSAIHMHIQMKRLDPSKPITVHALMKAGLFKPSSVKHGVKLLAHGKEMIQQPLHIVLNRASAEAIEAVEAQGGTVVSTHYNKLFLRVAMRPHKFATKAVLPKQARPPAKWQPYYTSWHKRGYLNPAVQMRSWFAARQEDTGDAASALEEKFSSVLKANQEKAGLLVDADGDDGDDGAVESTSAEKE